MSCIKLIEMMTGLDLGAIVSLDHNYAQICPIRILKGKDSHLNHNLWASISSVQPPRRHRTKSYNSDRTSDPGETLEEDDLIEYYSQWCDKVFSGDHSQVTAAILGANRAQNATTSRYNDYASDSTQRTSPSTNSDSLNNLNLLASCGTEEHRSREGNNESGSSISPSSARDQPGYESPKLENDYQVLAAANALLQLSGNETQQQSSSDYSKECRKRKSSYIADDILDDVEIGRSQVSSSLYVESTTNYYGGTKKNKVKSPPKFKFGTDSLKAKNPFVTSVIEKSEPANKKKKKKRKYKKTGKALAEDDDSIDSELNYPKIMFMPSSVLAQRHDPWGQAIPNDILANIFKHVIRNEGPLPTLHRLSKVCKLWYTVAREPCLWQNIDLSGEKVKKQKKHLIWLCKNRLSDVQHLSLANWELLTGKEIQVLSKHCQKLQSLSLSRCSKLNSGALRGLIENCTNLVSLDISYTSTVITSRYLLEYLLEARGGQLKSLNLGTNILVKFDIVMQSIIEKCSQLEVLDLSNVVFSNNLLSLQIETLQEGCPKLRILLLTNSSFKTKKPTIDPINFSSIGGFPCLETLSIARSTVSGYKYRYVNDEVLFRFLKTSSRLKHLDISGCRHVTNRGLQRLPTARLQSLNIAHCSLVNQSGIQDTLKKWSQSIRSLDLSNTTVESQFLRFLLDNIPNLSCLSLTGCRGIPWHMRREYQRDTLRYLRESLDNWNEADHELCMD